MDDLRLDRSPDFAPNDGLSWGVPASTLDHNAKIAALRQQLQLGADAFARGEFTEVDDAELENFFAKLRP